MKTEARGAKLSECKRYRWKLYRIWKKSAGMVLFIGLNPSKADDRIDDATVKRWRNFAKSWGYGGFYAVNLYAFRSTKQAGLWTAEDPIGPENDAWILDTAKRCEIAVACWGVGDRAYRQGDVMRLLSRRFTAIHCFKLTNEGHPSHPLRLRKDLEPQVWREFA